jgi:hypothetical protein
MVGNARATLSTCAHIKEHPPSQWSWQASAAAYRCLQDPCGLKLLETREPLEEANKLVRVLRKNAPRQLSTHKAAFSVARRQDLPLLALHAVKHARHLGGCDDPTAHRLLADLALWLSQRGHGDGNDIVVEVLEEELRELTGGCPQLDSLALVCLQPVLTKLSATNLGCDLWAPTCHGRASFELLR